MNHRPPFPWFGGKSRAAELVWSRLGDVANYVEPFFGSGAVMFLRPHIPRIETINDKDGFVANFWRAVKHKPEETAAWADNPVNENDQHARHAWLLERRECLVSRLEGDPEYCDPKIAGWWVWGICCWIGSGWCSGNGPWRVVDGKLVHLGGAGQGVNRQLAHLGNAGQGVNRQLAHLGNAGQGVNRKLVHLGDAGRGVNRQRAELIKQFHELAERLRNVRVCCGDWKRVCGGKTGDALRCLFSGGGVCAVFLDPPYADTANRTENLYREDCNQVAHDVRKWAVANGDNPDLRIALCGYEGEHQMPETWTCELGRATNGYSNQAEENNGNAKRERIWFSPHCLKAEQQELKIA